MYLADKLSGLGFEPVSAVVSAAALTKRIFGGQSAGFMKREADSKKFFETRDALLKMESQMSAQQLAEWRSLALHKVDYRTRRENASERSQLYDFVKKLSDPSAWSQPSPSLPLTTPAYQAVPGSPFTQAAATGATGDLVKSPVLIVAVLAGIIFLGRK